MRASVALLLFLLASNAGAATLPDAPQPVKTADYSSGFGFDNQIYALQGFAVSSLVGPITRRPWLGAAAGVGSCMAWRAIHDQSYVNDGMFSSNRVAFCALGSAVGYATTKWVLRTKKGVR